MPQHTIKRAFLLGLQIDFFVFDSLCLFGVWGGAPTNAQVLQVLYSGLIPIGDPEFILGAHEKRLAAAHMSHNPISHAGCLHPCIYAGWFVASQETGQDITKFPSTSTQQLYQWCQYLGATCEGEPRPTFSSRKFRNCWNTSHSQITG